MGLPTRQYNLSGLDSLETKKPATEQQVYDLSGIDELASIPGNLRSLNEQRAPQEPGLVDRILGSIPVGRVGKQIAESPLFQKVAQTPLLPVTKLLPPEGAPIYLPTPGGGTMVESEVGKGVVRGAARTIESLSTVENAAIGVAMAAASPAVAAIGAGAFAGMMASQLPDMWKQFQAAETTEQKAQVATEALAALGLTFAAGKHAVKAGARAVTPDVGKFASEGISAGVSEPALGGLDAIFGAPKVARPTELERPLTPEELASIMPEVELRKSEVGREMLRQQLTTEEAAAPVGETKAQRESRLAERAAALEKELAGQEAAQAEASKRSDLAEALSETAKGVGELLKPSGELRSGIGFTEEQYTMALPHFRRAWQGYKAAGKSYADFSRDMVARYGDQVTPYLNRFNYSEVNDLVSSPLVEVEGGGNYERYISNAHALWRSTVTEGGSVKDFINKVRNIEYKNDLERDAFRDVVDALIDEVRPAKLPVEARKFTMLGGLTTGEKQLLNIVTESPGEFIREGNIVGATKELATAVGKLLFDPTNYQQLNIGPGFSEAAYGNALPHFRAAWQGYKAAGKSFADFSRDVTAKYGDQVAPYLSRFESEVAPRPATATTSQVTGRSENDVRIISDSYLDEIARRAPSRPATQNSLLLMRVKGKIQSPEHVLRNNPVALDASSRVIDGENLVRQKYGQRMIAIDHARSGLSKGERLAVRDAAEKINDQEFSSRLKAANPKVHRAATTVRQVFDEMKDEVKQYKRVMFQLELPPRLRDAVMDVVDGRLTVEQSATKYAQTAFPKAKWTAETKAKKLSQIINKYNNEYRDIDNWGLKDFVTNIELGIYRVVDSAGHTRAVGDTRRAAAAKAKELQETMPSIGKLSITTEGRAFIDPLQRRRDILLGEKDIFKALPPYLYAVQKKIIFEPLVSEVRRVMRERPSDFPAPVKNVIESQIEYWRGKYHFGDQMADAVTTALGLRPKLWSRSVEKVRQVSANVALGYRLSSAGVNVATAAGKQLVKYGAAKTADALKWMRTEEGKRFLLEEEQQGALGVGVEVGAKGDLRIDLPWYHPLKAYTSVEPPVRRLNLATAYRQFLAEGYSDAAARIAARRAVRLINFSYNATAVPQILRSPAGRLVGQFKTYLAKEVELMSQLTAPEWGKYLSMQMMLAGPRGGILFLKALPVLGALGYWDDIAAALEKWNAPEAAKRGAAGAIGVDVGPQATLQLTSDRVEDNFGPALANIFRLFRDVIVPTFAGEGDVQERAIDWASSLAPMIKMTDQLIEATISEDGWVKDSGGNYLYNPSSELDKVKLLAGATPAELSKARTLLGIERKRAEVAKQNAMNLQKRIVLRLNKADQSLARLTAAIVRGINKGIDLPDDMVVDIIDLLAIDNQIDKQMGKDIGALGITSEAIRDRIEQSRTPPEARAVIRAKLIRKAEAAGLLLQ